ncbi:hypothetical protein CXF51_12180 [Bacillus subtilis subsp. subtilis]|nr:hypothetical protein CXF51_12180 [Bacillus subtilis subsp. subtilis]
MQWPTILTGISFNPVFYWAVNQAIVQRALGARIWINLILVAARFSNGNFRLTKRILANAKILFYLNQPFSFDRVMASIRFFTSSFSRIIEM